MNQLPATPVAAAHDWQLLVELRTAALAADDPMAVEGQQQEGQQQEGQQQEGQQGEVEAGTPAYRSYSLFGGGGGGFGTGEGLGWAGGKRCTLAGCAGMASLWRPALCNRPPVFIYFPILRLLCSALAQAGAQCLPRSPLPLPPPPPPSSTAPLRAQHPRQPSPPAVSVSG